MILNTLISILMCVWLGLELNSARMVQIWGSLVYNLYDSANCKAVIHVTRKSWFCFLIKEILIKEKMLKTVVLHNIFVESEMLFIFQDSQINRNIYLKYKYFVTKAFGFWIV